MAWDHMITLSHYIGQNGNHKHGEVKYAKEKGEVKIGIRKFNFSERIAEPIDKICNKV